MTLLPGSFRHTLRVVSHPMHGMIFFGLLQCCTTRLRTHFNRTFHRIAFLSDLYHESIVRYPSGGCFEDLLLLEALDIKLLGHFLFLTPYSRLLDPPPSKYPVPVFNIATASSTISATISPAGCTFSILPAT